MGRWDWAGLAALSGAVAVIGSSIPAVAQQTNGPVIREARLGDSTVQQDRRGGRVDSADDPTGKPDVRRDKARAAMRRSYAERSQAVRDTPSTATPLSQRQIEQLGDRGGPRLQRLPTSPQPAQPRTFSIPTSPQAPPVVIVLDGHYTRASVPTVSGGTQFDPVSLREISVVKGPSVVNGGGGGVNATFRAIATRSGFVDVDLSAFIYEVDGSRHGLVPVGGNSVAQTYIFPNPVSGSTGILAGATGQSVGITTRGQMAEAILATTWVSPNWLTMNGFPVTKEKGFGFHYRNFDRQDTITQQSLFFSDLNSTINLDTSSNFYAARFVGGLRVDPQAAAGFLGGVRGTASLGVLSTDASASQNSRCGPCGAASPEFNINLQRDVSENKFTFAAGVNAYVGYQFNPGTKVVLEASYEYMDKTPVFSVPTTPTQQPIKLDYRDMSTLRVGGKLVFDVYGYFR